MYNLNNHFLEQKLNEYERKKVHRDDIVFSNAKMMEANKSFKDNFTNSSKKEKYEYFPYVDGEKLTKRHEVDKKNQQIDYNKFLKDIGSLTPGRLSAKKEGYLFGSVMPSSWEKQRPV